MIRKSLYIALISVLLISCSNEELKTVGDLDTYIKNPENGLVKVKEVNGYRMVMQLLPSEYLALKEKPTDKTTFDSIQKEYSQSMNFLFSIEPDGEKRKNDVVMNGVRNYEEYKQKFTSLSFGIQDYFSIQNESASYYPVLSNMEPVYQLKAGRSFNIVFAPQDEQSIQDFEEMQNIDIVFEDAFFDTGINHFVFNKKDLKNIPTKNLKFTQL